LLVRIIGPRS